VNTEINLSAAAAALDGIQTTDPKIVALRELHPKIKERVEAGATMKQIVTALAPIFGADEKWLARAIAQLRARRGGGRPPKSAKPQQAGGAEPAATPRRTLRLAKPPAAAQAGEGA
jgi:hypothetical protein